MKNYYKKLGFNVCSSIVLFSVSSLAALNAREICYVSGETCTLSYNTAGYYYQRVCKPTVSCHTVPDPVPSPASPSQPSPSPPPSPLGREECIKSAQDKYGQYVANAKITVLDGASTRCMNKHRVEYMSYSLTGNDNAYSQCVRGEEQSYADMVAGAKAVLEARLQGCPK